MSDNNLTNTPKDAREFGHAEITGARDAQTATDAFAPTAFSNAVCYSVEWDTSEFVGCEPAAE